MDNKQTLKDIAVVIIFGASLYLIASLADYMFGNWAGWVAVGLWAAYGVGSLILAIKRVLPRRSDTQ